jgi:hypothetical protein
MLNTPPGSGSDWWARGPQGRNCKQAEELKGVAAASAGGCQGKTPPSAAITASASTFTGGTMIKDAEKSRTALGTEPPGLALEPSNSW